VRVALALDRLRQRLAPFGHREDEDGRESREGRDLRAARPVVVLGAEVHVAVDGAREHDLPSGVDGLGRVRQHVDRPERGHAPILDRDPALEHLRGGDDSIALDYQIDPSGGAHSKCTLGAVTNP
jgi:hypothetical protein